MKVRSVLVGVLCAVALLVSVQPAAAQAKRPEFAVGYQFLRFLDEGENVPAGWGASVAGAINDMFKIVGDIGGNHLLGDDDGYKIYTFQGGVELATRNPRVTPFVRLLAGMAWASEDNESETAFVFTPEAGVKVMGTSRIGGQFTIGFPLIRDQGLTFKLMRVFFGVAIR